MLHQWLVQLAVVVIVGSASPSYSPDYLQHNDPGTELTAKVLQHDSSPHVAVQKNKTVLNTALGTMAQVRSTFVSRKLQYANRRDSLGLSSNMAEFIQPDGAFLSPQRRFFLPHISEEPPVISL